jgi:hypothetical protein
MKFDLGIIINKDGKIINHRSIIKVFLNPFFRIFGYAIATYYNKITDKLEGICIIRCMKIFNLNFKYDNDEYYTVVKKRIFI